MRNAYRLFQCRERWPLLVEKSLECVLSVYTNPENAIVVHRLSPTHGWMKRAEGAGAFRPLNAAIGYDGL
jgi:hypothetical protein